MRIRDARTTKITSRENDESSDDEIEDLREAKIYLKPKKRILRK